MPENPESRYEFGSKESVQRLTHYLNQQADILERTKNRVVEKSEDLWFVLHALIHSVKDSAGSLVLLAEHDKARDAFVVARTMYETIINACFVAAKGKEAAERAMRHSMQKSYRDLHRVSEINKQKVVLKWDTTVDISKVPEFKAALEEFTGNKGREITSWTPETVEKRLEEIDKRYGQKVSTGLQFGLIAIYRHASEIAHGTFFGAMFILGLTNPMGPPKDIHSIASSMRGNLCMLLQMTGHCVESLIVVLAEELKLPELAQEARELTIELSKESAEGAV